MKLTLIIILLLVTFTRVGCAQQKNDTIYRAYLADRSEEIEYHSLEKLEESSAKEFQGNYHFGSSEAESDLSIIFSHGKWFAKEEYGVWEQETWARKTDRIKVSYNDNTKVIKLGENATEYFAYTCVDNSNLFLKKGAKGIGFSFTETENGKVYRYIQFNEGIKIKTIGKYPEASFVKLTKEELGEYTKYELQIMRNEIFARKGYVFKKDGKMDNYFSTKEWYKTITKTNNPDLNEIEKYNVNLIITLEKQ
ncbi:YARHG domain-containing protein [Aquimarina sp. D1M17]|uniref:YARHG domain-containing protein n=1 Tax=Aquimarina acroporae TaxID=2937283 RepID=UPI0020BE2746|nr:YARHG domain-containing protein [Aquimarina acroporae]MCK8520455.1 YARHG domain-containing protein [Aquimarina acroporae]